MDGTTKKSGRRYPRTNLSADAYLHCSGRRYPAKVMNISVGGVLVALKGMMAVYAEKAGVRFAAPVFLEIPALKLRGAVGQISRSQFTGKPLEQRLGVQFAHIRPDIQYRVDHLAGVSS